MCLTIGLRSSLLGLVMLFATAFPALAEGQGRYALVIGNSAYARFEPLPNPVRDASDLGGALAQLGFDVTYGLDVDMRELMSVVQKFAAESRNGAEVVFFFAGHGFQLDGSNQLVPVDAVLNDRESAFSETVDLRAVIGMLQQNDRPTIILLDASSSNPLPETVRTAADQQGLADVDPGADVFIATAASPGQTSMNGAGRNSPFTEALLNRIRTPGLAIEDIFAAVRTEVGQATQGKQVPWFKSSLRQRFYFLDGPPGSQPEAKGIEESGTGQSKPAPPPAASQDTSVEALQNVTGQPAGEDAPTVGNQTVGDSAGSAGDEQARAKEAAAAAAAAAQADAKRVEAEKKARRSREEADAKQRRARQEQQKSTARSNETKVKGNRPNARAYSFQVWGFLAIPNGVVRKKTPYGTLMCKTRYLSWETNEDRRCQWE